MKDKGEKYFLTAEEISEYFMIPLNTIYRLSKAGKIKGTKIGKQWRYLRSDIEGLISSGISPRILPAKNSPDFEERREYPRMNCNMGCRYSVDIQLIKRFQSNTGSVRNISGGGALLYDRHENLERIAVGDPIGLNFELPVGSRGIIINTQGRVVRVSGGGTVVYGLGIKFRKIDKGYQDEIINYVD